MKPHRWSQRSRLAALLTVAAIHLAIAALDMFDLTRFSGVSDTPVLQGIADHPAWMWLHIGSSLLLIFAAATGRRTTLACSVSFGIMFSWSVLLLLWALTVTLPVSLTGPALGLGVAGVTFALNLSWSDDS